MLPAIEPMVPFLLLLEVHIPLFGVDIREIDAQPAMSDNGAEVVHLSAPQQWHTTLDLTGRPRHLSEWGIPVGNNHGSSCGTTGPGEDNLLFLLLFLRFGDGGPTVGNSRHKHLTEGDQRFYSGTEEPFAARSKGCRERPSS